MKIIISVLSILIFSFIILVIINYKTIAINNISQKELVIKGTPRFKDQISKALALLKEKAPEAYAMVNEYVGTIEQRKRTSMGAQKIPPRMSMANKSTYFSLTWCAGTIAHEAFHSKLYHDYRRKHPWRFWPVPRKIWANFEAERKCVKYQLEVLKQINAPIGEIFNVAKQDGTHGDQNGDGKIDRKEYSQIDW